MTFSITDYQLTALDEPHQGNFTSTVNFDVLYNGTPYSLAYYCANGYGDDPAYFAFDELNPGAYMLTEPPLSVNPYLPQDAIDTLTREYIDEQIAIYIFHYSNTVCTNLGFLQGVDGNNTLDPEFYASDYPTLKTAETSHLMINFGGTGIALDDYNATATVEDQKLLAARATKADIKLAEQRIADVKADKSETVPLKTVLRTYGMYDGE